METPTEVDIREYQEAQLCQKKKEDKQKKHNKHTDSNVQHKKTVPPESSNKENKRPGTTDQGIVFCNLIAFRKLQFFNRYQIYHYVSIYVCFILCFIGVVPFTSLP